MQTSDRLLARAFEFEIPRTTETDWPYDFNSSTGGTPSPTPRDNHATLWMTCNHSDSVFQDLCQFFEMAKAKLKAKVERVKSNNSNRVVVKDLASSKILLRGIMYSSSARPEANVGRYAMFQADTEKGCELVVKISSFTNWGYTAYLFHDRVTRLVEKNKTLVVTTGLDTHHQNVEKGISTRFDLLVDGTIAARCHLSYRDTSSDPSIGPTIEMIATKKSFRGRGVLHFLWFWVKTFIEDNFTLESLNVEAPAGHVMIKATKLINTEIELNESGTSSSSSSVITDKDFFFNQAGFSVRRQMNVHGRPLDEEAVLYIPLLSQKQVKERAEKRFVGDEAVEYTGWQPVKGARICRNCQRIKASLLRCTKCRNVHYCNVQCQKKDFKNHKRWCGKSYQELHEELVKLGRRIQNDNGSWSTILS